jgi:hypothetical protein
LGFPSNGSFAPCHPSLEHLVDEFLRLDLNNQPIRLPGLKPGVCSGLILSGAYYPNLKIGVLRRERIKGGAPVGVTRSFLPP